jgi:hypothetical protein
MVSGSGVDGTGVRVDGTVWGSPHGFGRRVCHCSCGIVTHHEGLHARLHRFSAIPDSPGPSPHEGRYSQLILKQPRLLTLPTLATTSPARPESAKTASLPRDAPYSIQGHSKSGTGSAEQFLPRCSPLVSRPQYSLRLTLHPSRLLGRMLKQPVQQGRSE